MSQSTYLSIDPVMLGKGQVELRAFTYEQGDRKEQAKAILFHPFSLREGVDKFKSILRTPFGSAGTLHIELKVYKESVAGNGGVVVYPQRVIDDGDDCIAKDYITIDISDDGSEYTVYDMCKSLLELLDSGYLLETDSGEKVELVNAKLCSVMFSEENKFSTVVLTL